MDITKILTGQDIAYLARGSIDTVANINKTKKYIRKAFEKQMNNEGFSLVEVLAPCPTNWGLSPHDSLERIDREGAFTHTETIRSKSHAARAEYR